ncbi:amidohydrolase family protein [Kitasatospora sp. NPDC093679]|uniref:amidohydrolase family protein n=1 Tax=Kitasatospora sp. NPDC093679 TaxID=3154983 RepID=UPI003412387D
MTASTATVFRGVRPFGVGEPVDLVAVDGLPAAQVPEAARVEVVDGGGRIALPTPVDAHVHPDMTAWGEPWYSRRPAAGLPEYVQGDVDLYAQQRTPVAERARRLPAHAVAPGTRAVPAHVDVAPAHGLAGVEGLATARELLRGAPDVQVVAFPQHGVRRTPGAGALPAEAAASGPIDAVGGIDPAGFDRAGFDGVGAAGEGPDQLDQVFGLAERHGLLVDVHLHDAGERGPAPLRDIAARTRAAGMQGRVVVSRVFCVPELSGAAPAGPAELPADAGIGLTTVAPSAHQVLPFRVLAEHGVRVGLGSDGVRDSWSPFGNADVLHRAHLLGWTTDARTDGEPAECFAPASAGGAALPGLPAADPAPGSPADFLPQVVVDPPRRGVAVRVGRMVARDGRFTG